MKINSGHRSLRTILISVSFLFLGACASSSGKNSPPAPDPDLQTADTGQHWFSSEFASVLLRNPEIKYSAKKANAADDLWLRLRQGFDLPKLDDKRVRYYENKFSHNPEYFASMLERASWFLPYILTEVEKRGYPTELALLPAVESSFISDAKSRTGASGLWQFIPSTGRLYGLNENWWYDGRRDPVRSTQAALDFLGELDERFDGNWFHAIAGYNAGGGTIEKAIRKNRKKRKSTAYSDLSLRQETKDYVPKLIAFRNIFMNPKKYGLTLPPLGNAQRFASLDAGSQIDLNLFARKTGIDPKTLRFLNSAYRHNVTPPDGPHIIYLPARSFKTARATLGSMAHNDRLRWARYRIKKGDSLGRIARQYKVSVASIQQSNKLKSNLIRVGDTLVIPVVGSTQTTIASKSANKNDKLMHHVQKGDTLWAIAKRYGVKVADISKWNKINKNQTLKPGQELTIYPRS